MLPRFARPAPCAGAASSRATQSRVDRSGVRIVEGSGVRKRVGIAALARRARAAGEGAP
jgi:hypothetical protein